MTIKNKSIKVLLDNISKAKVILKTQEKLNYFPEYVKMVKKEIKEMQKEIKSKWKKHLTKSGFTLKGGRHSWITQEHCPTQELRGTGFIPGNYH